MAGFVAVFPAATTYAMSTANLFILWCEIISTSRRMAQAFEQFSDMPIEASHSWIRDDNISVYDLNMPNRTVGANYPVDESILVSPVAKRHTLGLVGGNEVSRLAGNPQDIESDLRGLTRPLTKCNEREYQPLKKDQDTIIYDNRKYRMAIDLRPVHLKDTQMFAYAPVYAPQPLKKETCGRPEKY